jgi:hypothetical protein
MDRFQQGRPFYSDLAGDAAQLPGAQPGGVAAKHERVVMTHDSPPVEGI